jgi:hypothetical protein
MLTVWALATVGMSSSRAAASGDAKLERLILDDPGAGWVSAPPAVQKGLADLERRALSAVVQGRVAVAARVWRNGKDNLIVVLIATPRALPNSKQQARSAVLAMCASATSNPPASISDFAEIPGASEAVCSGQNPAGTNITGAGIAWPKKNLLVMMGGSGLSLEDAEALATEQAAALPSSGLKVGAQR